jgi:predicted ATP-dependent endonuclease of OLD family
MKIKFWNLGSIKEAELDLRPLTVIIGPNNSNKTYIAYSIYGLWKEIESYHMKISTVLVKTPINQKLESKLIIEENGNFSIEKKQFYELIIQQIKDSSKKISGNFWATFFQDSSGKIFDKTKLEVDVDENDIQQGVNKFLLLFQEEAQRGILDMFYISKIEQSNKKFLIYPYKDKESSSIVINDAYFVFILLVLIAKKIFSDILPLPAERNAFINTYKMLANRRYKLLKDRDRGLFSRRRMNTERQLELLQEQGDIRYPQPVEDFLDFLSDIELENNPDPDPDNKNEFQKLADQIEEHIQNKNKTKFKSTKFGGREIKISVKRGLEIDLYNASSSIKQLAPLLLYLRYRAKAGDFLVIDEPEMNLHPESQVKLLEALAILVNLGVRVLLTTHSPYLMAHLNNIVNGNHQDQDILEAQAQSLYLQDSQAFLKMEQVSAYEMKNNKLISLHDPDYGIRWDTLSDVSVDVQQKFFTIYEAGQKSKDTEA